METLYLVAGVGILLVASELAVAFIAYPIARGISYYDLYRPGEDTQWMFVFVFHPKRGFTLRPNMRYSNPTTEDPNGPRRIFLVDVRTDENAFVSNCSIDDLKGKLIFCLGGSTTMGSEARFDKTYPAELGKLVSELGYTCVNAGTGAYRSIHELITLKQEILPRNPWGVIIFSGYNDFEDFAYGISKPYNPFTHSVRYAVPGSRLEQLLFNSALIHVTRRALKILFKERRRTEAPPPTGVPELRKALENPRWLEEWRTNVTEMIRACKAKGVRAFLLAHVSPVYPGASNAAKELADRELLMKGRFDLFVEYVALINREAQRLCEETGATYIDISADYERLFLKAGTMDYVSRYSDFVDRMHFTETGNRHIAQLIFDKLIPEL